MTVANDPDPGGDALTAVAFDLLRDQVLDFYDAVNSGEVEFDAGGFGQGIPEVLSSLHGRRRDRTLQQINHDDPSILDLGPFDACGLYGTDPETCANSALRALQWVVAHDPLTPIRLTPSLTGMLDTTYALPGDVTVSHIILLDRVEADDIVVTGESLMAAARNATISAGNALTGPGLALDETQLVESSAPAPARPPRPEVAPTHRTLILPLETVDFFHQILPPAPGADEGLLMFATFTTSGDPYLVPVHAATQRAIGWLDPFAVNTEVDHREELFVGVGERHYWIWGNKTVLQVPRPPRR